MSGQFTIASRSGRLRAESDGQGVHLYVDDGYTNAVVYATVEEFRQVLGHIFDTADEQLSDRDLDRIAERVTRRLVGQLTRPRPFKLDPPANPYPADPKLG